MNTTLPIHIIEDEPRVLDTDLAASLGMKRADRIRDRVIAPNRAEFDGLGNLPSAVTNSGARGRPGTAYYLNEEQALLVCMLSRTPQAKQVRAEVIRVFVAWRRGELGPTARPQLDLLPPPSFQSDAVTRDDLRKQCEWITKALRFQTEDVERRFENRLSGIVKAIADQIWYGAGHLKKHLFAPETLARNGVQLLPAPTPETTFVTVYEVCREVFDDDQLHPHTTAVVARAILDHARRHQWPQGQTEKRSRGDRTRPTFPRARTDEWLSAGGRAFIEAKNRRLSARSGE